MHQKHVGLSAIALKKKGFFKKDAGPSLKVLKTDFSIKENTSTGKPLAFLEHSSVDDIILYR